MITNLEKIQKQLEENLKKINAIGINPEMDEDDIDDLLLENKLRDVDNETYKLIKEITNYSNIYEDAKDIENIEEIEAEAQKMLTAYDEYNIEDAYNIFKNIFNAEENNDTTTEEKEKHHNILRDGQKFTVQGWYNYNIEEAIRGLQRLKYEFNSYYEQYDLIIKFENSDLDAESLFDILIEYYYPSIANPCLDFKEMYEDDFSDDDMFYILDNINQARNRIIDTDYEHQRFMNAINKTHEDYLVHQRESLSDFNEENILKYYYNEGDEE